MPIPALSDARLSRDSKEPLWQQLVAVLRDGIENGCPRPRSGAPLRSRPHRPLRRLAHGRAGGPRRAGPPRPDLQDPSQGVVRLFPAPGPLVHRLECRLVGGSGRHRPNGRHPRALARRRRGRRARGSGPAGSGGYGGAADASPANGRRHAVVTRPNHSPARPIRRPAESQSGEPLPLRPPATHLRRRAGGCRPLAEGGHPLGGGGDAAGAPHRGPRPGHRVGCLGRGWPAIRVLPCAAPHDESRFYVGVR